MNLALYTGVTLNRSLPLIVGLFLTPAPCWAQERAAKPLIPSAITRDVVANDQNGSKSTPPPHRTLTADVVELKAGQRVDGVVKSISAKNVVIEVDGQAVSFERTKVGVIYLGGAPTISNFSMATTNSLPNPIAAPSLRVAALQSLKGLQSATTAGINYTSYAPRVTDAEIIVDRYLSEETSDLQAVKVPLKAAMQFYALAAKAWNYEVSGQLNFTLDGSSELIAQCTVAQQVINAGRAQQTLRGVSQDILDALYLKAQFAVLWQCASEQITDADKVVAGLNASATPFDPGIQQR
jgi:hypothetical protein